MGTNYYWQESEPCAACGRGYEQVHVGKSSAGWCFSLHVSNHCVDRAPEDQPAASLDD